MIRLFAAIAVPPEAAEALATHQNGLRGARWRTAETLHITLRFFGDVNERQAEDIAIELDQARGDRFAVGLSGVGSFGEGERIRAVWAGVEESPTLRLLAGRCEAAARRAGCEPESRNYAPHVTLAYLRRADQGEVATWMAHNNLLKIAPLAVERFGLYSSWPGEGSTRYELEQFYRLGRSAPE